MYTAFFVGMRWYGTEGTGLQHAVTMGFTTLALAQVSTLSMPARGGDRHSPGHSRILGCGPRS